MLFVFVISGKAGNELFFGGMFNARQNLSV